MKTCEHFINGSFTCSNAEGALPVADRRGKTIGRVCVGAQKDLDTGASTARAAQRAWADRDASDRGRVLLTLARAVEERCEEFAEAIRTTGSATLAAARREASAAADLLLCFAGWSDKLACVLGGQNTVAGPYYNITAIEPAGVVGIVAPDEPAMLGLVTLIAAPLCAGNAIVALVNVKRPLPASLLAECCQSSDIPPGVVNIIFSKRPALLDDLAKHRDIDMIAGAGLPKSQASILKLTGAESSKRVHVIRIRPGRWLDAELCHSPSLIELFVETKAIWHPSAT